MRSILQIWVGLSLLAFAAAGCLPRPDGPGSRITDIPDTEELLGAWTLSQESITLLKNFQFKGDLDGRTHTISLLPDGVCKISVYDTYTVFQSAPQKYLQCTGRWQVRAEREIVKYVSIILEWEEDGRPVTTSLRLARHGGRVVLWGHITDPDARVYYEFIKEKGASNHVMERTADKALVSGGRWRMFPAGLVWANRQAVAHHTRSTPL